MAFQLLGFVAAQTLLHPIQCHDNSWSNESIPYLFGFIIFVKYQTCKKITANSASFCYDETMYRK